MNDSDRGRIIGGRPKEKFVGISFSLLGVLAVFILSGCTAAVPYAISAAKIVSDSSVLSPPSSTVQPTPHHPTANRMKIGPINSLAKKNTTRPLPILRERADKQDTKAQNQLALLYYEGKGVPEDEGRAAEWMRKAAEGGDAHSQYMLAWFFYKGIGVAQDYAKTIEWAQKAMEKGDTNAIVLLARLHRLGRGVSQNYTKALELLYLADQSWKYLRPGRHCLYVQDRSRRSQGLPAGDRLVFQGSGKGNASGWTQLAYLYATCKEAKYVDGKKAVAYGLKGTEREPDDFSSWSALAAAYARNNQFDQAIEAATKSDTLLQANTKLSRGEKEEISSKAQIRLNFFKDNTPFTEENVADQEY